MDLILRRNIGFSAAALEKGDQIIYVALVGYGQDAMLVRLVVRLNWIQAVVQVRQAGAAAGGA